MCSCSSTKKCKTKCDTCTCVENEKALCYGCEKEFDDFDLNISEVNDELYCDRCMEECFKYCTCCDKQMYDTDKWEFEGEIFCEDCYNEQVIECYECGKEFFEGDGEFLDGECYCSNCYENNFVGCWDCGYEGHRDRMMYDDYNDCYYCEGCYEDRSRYCICFNPKRLSHKDCTFEHIKSKRCFGIELEVDSEDLPYQDIKDNTSWGCKEDGSIDMGGEFYSPILKGDVGYNQIKKLCGYLKGHYATESAGYHLHIDGRRLSYRSIKRVWLLFRMMENRFFRIVEIDRRDNNYCMASDMDTNSIKQVKNSRELKDLWYNYDKNHGGDRYQVTNLCSYFFQRTVEIRVHQGTTDFYEIVNWIKLNLALFDYAVKGSIRKIESLFKDVETWKNFDEFVKPFEQIIEDKEVIKYLKERYGKMPKL